MINSSYDAKTIHGFWKSLEDEGWMVDEKIPSGWRVRRLDEDVGDWEYLSSSMTVLASTEEAAQCIQNSGNFEQIINFEAWRKEIGQK